MEKADKLIVHKYARLLPRADNLRFKGESNLPLILSRKMVHLILTRSHYYSIPIRYGGEMPSIDIQVLEGVFSTEDKRLMIEKVTEAFREVVGETLRAEQQSASTKFKVVLGATAVSR